MNQNFDKIPIRILPDIKEISFKALGTGLDLENQTYYFNKNKAKLFKKILCQQKRNLKNFDQTKIGCISNDFEQFFYDFKIYKNPEIIRPMLAHRSDIYADGHKISDSDRLNFNYNPKFNNINNIFTDDKLNVSIIVGHNNIFKKQLNELFTISKPIYNNEKNDNNSKILKQDYIKWYHSIFEKLIHESLNYKVDKESNLNQLYNKFLIEKIIIYILSKRVRDVKRIDYYIDLHKKLIDDKKNFFEILSKRINTKQDTQITNYQEIKLDVANGTVILIYKDNQNNLIVKLLFHGFPDKDRNTFLDYDFKINLSKDGYIFFNKLLNINQGIIFVRHEHGFHNGSYKLIRVLDSPLSNLGIFKSMMINNFLNQSIFQLSNIGINNGLTDKKSLFDLININQMIVSPLIRTHMTGLLIFDNDFNIKNYKFNSQNTNDTSDTNDTKSLSSESNNYEPAEETKEDYTYNEQNNEKYEYVKKLIDYYKTFNINNNEDQQIYNLNNITTIFNNNKLTKKIYKFINFKKNVKTSSNNLNKKTRKNKKKQLKHEINKDRIILQQMNKKLKLKTDDYIKEIKKRGLLKKIILNKDKFLNNSKLNQNVEFISDELINILSDISVYQGQYVLLYILNNLDKYNYDQIQSLSRGNQNIGNGHIGANFGGKKKLTKKNKNKKKMNKKYSIKKN